MKKHHLLKTQFLAGVIIAYSILIGAFFYYLSKQNDYANNTFEFSESFRSKSEELSSFENQLLKIYKIKSDFLIYGSSRQLSQINAHAQSAHDYLSNFEEINPFFDKNLPEISRLRKLLADVTNIDSLQTANTDKSIEERAIAMASEEQHIHNTCDEVIATVFQLKKQRIEQEKHALNNAFRIVLPLGIIALLAILYVLYATFNVSEGMRVYSVREKKSRAELSVANERFETINWILQRTNNIYDDLIGIDEIEKVGNIALDSIAQSLTESFYAGAIYVKSEKSDVFKRIAILGFDTTETINEFKIGQGILGLAAQDKKQKIYEPEENAYIHLNSTFIDRINPQIALVPIVHEHEIVGLLEFAGKIDDDNKERITEYLSRATRTVAAAIKSGKNHAVVQKLLEMTQKQTEELQAQQEELRITNEELVHKTNMLESSEEELRVQQEELSQSNRELNVKAAELENRNLELKQAQKDVELKIKEVKQASEYKSEFMANMSHELRTPLNSILILAKILQDNKTANLTDEQCKYASVIYGAGSDLLELINQLLDLAKIESGKVEVLSDNIHSSGLVLRLENLFKQTAQAKNITFSSSKETFPDYFVSDEYRLEQVLKNFLSNAFKFTNAGGKVLLALSHDEKELHFSVVDNGKGIPAEKIELIFEAFRQVDGSTNRKYGGTGLGLSISREIATLLGGRIDVESQINEGSRFTLSIPYTNLAPRTISTQEVLESQVLASNPKALESLSVELSKDAGKSRTILIIEDDFNFANILKDFAEQFMFDTQIAYDGEQGIEMAKKHLPDAIILDVMLPIFDGWEVLQTLKADPVTKFIPVHMMSSATYNQKDILERGAIGFLPKPLSEEHIKKVFSNIILNIDQGVQKVLLVEDQEVMSDLIKNTFAEKNINLLQAFTKKTALEKLRTEENIDCVILDVSLPDGNGLDLLEEIKTDENLKHIPVCINTAEDLSEEQAYRIRKYTKALIRKDGTSNSRLIDEVGLFLNKLNDSEYQPIHHSRSFEKAKITDADTLKGKRVLLVDDDMRNVFALTTALQEHELIIEIANNGREALEAMEAAKENFDIVLMDIMMPEMDGYEAIEHIRSEPKNAKLPIIAVTAKAMKGDHEKLIQLGANDYVSKPIDMRQLIALMQVWLS
ncbi:response regulator [Sphingobacterium corticis]|uniref:histidine kinase n=1 Tax=Sphingobacterium corticis TaxID=1812823 RepID=A0ABW5NN33_9SPHI